MSDTDGLLDRGRSVAAEHPRLAAVPLATALLAVDNIRRVAEFRGTHGGVSFAVPAPILDVWAFVSVPSQGVSGPDAVPLALLPVFAVVDGLLAAGYLGAIRDALREERPAFLDGVRRHAPALVGYQLLSLVAIFLLIAPGLVTPLLLVVVVPAVVAAAYLFYGAPYLAVAREQSLVASLDDSYRLATGGGAYAALFVGVLLGGAALSLVATPLVVNLGLFGVLVGTVVLAPVGLVVNAATMALFLRLSDDGGTGDGAPIDGTGDDGVPVDRTGDDGGARGTPAGVESSVGEATSDDAAESDDATAGGAESGDESSAESGVGDGVEPDDGPGHDDEPGDRAA